MLRLFVLATTVTLLVGCQSTSSVSETMAKNTAEAVDKTSRVVVTHGSKSAHKYNEWQHRFYSINDTVSK